MTLTGSIGHATECAKAPGVDFLPSVLYTVYCKEGEGLRGIVERHYSPQALKQLLPYINKPKLKAEVYIAIRSNNYGRKQRTSIIANEIRALYELITEVAEYVRLSWKIFKLKRGRE